MKTLFLLSLAVVLTSCSSKKSTVPASGNSLGQIKSKSACPSDGQCVIELFRNKSLVVKTDGIGATYNQLEDSAETSVIIYQYNRDVPEGLQDGNHREEIIFEIKNGDTDLTLSGNELQQTKMLFGRFCFCRGQTGYYKVTNGDLNVHQEKGIISFRLNFTINEVPQTINSVVGTIK